jgi:hypothetical protein
MKQYLYVFLSAIFFALAISVIIHSIKNLKTDTFALSATPAPLIAKIISPTPIPLPTVSPTSIPISPVQVLRGTYGPPDGFLPYEFTVRVGIPVRLEVLATEDGMGCMSTLMVPDFSDKIEFFEKGKTAIIEFTPDRPGNYFISCAMGIPHANLIVK